MTLTAPATWCGRGFFCEFASEFSPKGVDVSFGTIAVTVA